MLTFIAEYPNSGNIKDGMMIRIKEIDRKYEHVNRQYLDIGFVRNANVSARKEVLSENLIVYKFNFFINFFSILKKIKQSNSVYIHTLFNYAKVALFLNVFFLKKKIALDLHGVIPEELLFQGATGQSRFYALMEKWAINRANYLIYVTNVLKAHIVKKYQLQPSHDRDIVLGIIHSLEHNDPTESKGEDFVVKEDEVVFIYSGGIQKWQNIPLMLETIQKLNNEHYRFVFLTGQLDYVKTIVAQYGLSDKILVRSVDPKQLGVYYSQAHYGFVLRDPIIVNKVSNPTKLSEYLVYGITPVVLDECIGDYYELGYEFIRLTELNNSLPIKKSIRNTEVYQKYYEAMRQTMLPF